MRVRLIRIKPFYRKSGDQIREYNYELDGDVVSAVYKYAEKIWLRYQYVSKIEPRLIRKGKKIVKALRIVDDRPNAIPIYVDTETGDVYVPKAYLEKYGARFVHAVVGYFIYGSGVYRVKSRTLEKPPGGFE